jgi:hypothetical protein
MKNRIHKKKLNDLKAIMGCLALDRSGLHAGIYILLALSFLGGGSLSSTPIILVLAAWSAMVLKKVF